LIQHPSLTLMAHELEVTMTLPKSFFILVATSLVALVIFSFGNPEWNSMIEEFQLKHFPERFTHYMWRDDDGHQTVKHSSEMTTEDYRIIDDQTIVNSATKIDITTGLTVDISTFKSGRKITRTYQDDVLIEIVQTLPGGVKTIVFSIKHSIDRLQEFGLNKNE